MANVPTADQIRDAVLDHFLRTGEPLRVSAIHNSRVFDSAPVSEYSVKKVISAHFGAVPGTTCTEVEVPRFSKSYTMYQVGVSLAAALEPTKEHLRQVILAYRPGP